MNLDDIKKILSNTADVLGMVSPAIAAAVKVGTLAVDVYNDFEAARAEIAALAAKDQITKAEIDALDDSIQARSARIKALLNPPTD